MKRHRRRKDRMKRVRKVGRWVMRGVGVVVSVAR